MPSSSSSSARVANLLRLMHAVTHDLSNPLQALVLHATMGAEDAEPGSEAAQRHQADVEATRRMRTLLRAIQGLSTAGERPRSLASVQARFTDVFGERYARLGVPLETAAFHGPAREVSALVEETLLGLGLALGSRVRQRVAGLDAIRLVVRAGSPATEQLALELVGEAGAAAAAEIAGEVGQVDASVEVRAEGAALVLHATMAGGAA